MSIRNRIVPGDGDPRHGTYNGYNNHSCRCDECKRANADDSRPRLMAWRRARGVQPREQWESEHRTRKHGDYGMYAGSGCRCDLCRATATAYKRRLRAAARESAQQ